MPSLVLPNERQAEGRLGGFEGAGSLEGTAQGFGPGGELALGDRILHVDVFGRVVAIAGDALRDGGQLILIPGNGFLDLDRDGQIAVGQVRGAGVLASVEQNINQQIQNLMTAEKHL